MIGMIRVLLVLGLVACEREAREVVAPPARPVPHAMVRPPPRPERPALHRAVEPPGDRAVDDSPMDDEVVADDEAQNDDEIIADDQTVDPRVDAKVVADRPAGDGR